MNLLLYILLYEVKVFPHHVHLILIKILHLNHMTLNTILVSLMKPKLTIHQSHIALSNIPNRYRPLHLPHVLHDFPTKHYKYLPKFDGESKNLTAEKHLQSFEHFLDLFEVEHDDVCMRDFFQSLQGDVKEWFKHLQPESINTWEEFSDIFLKFWGERRPLDQIISEFYSLKK